MGAGRQEGGQLGCRAGEAGGRCSGRGRGRSAARPATLEGPAHRRRPLAAHPATGSAPPRPGRPASPPGCCGRGPSRQGTPDVGGRGHIGPCRGWPGAHAQAAAARGLSPRLVQATHRCSSPQAQYPHCRWCTAKEANARSKLLVGQLWTNASMSCCIGEGGGRAARGVNAKPLLVAPRPHKQKTRAWRQLGSRPLVGLASAGQQHQHAAQGGSCMSLHVPDFTHGWLVSQHRCPSAPTLTAAHLAQHPP